MFVINARNVHQALPIGMERMKLHGERRESRNGDVMVMPAPTTTLYNKPCERVMFWSERNCNPFFHFYEGLWMLAGRNDVASVAHYVSRMASFSDDGATLHGAYGHRWRTHFGRDQLRPIIDALKSNPEDRRNVLQMWDATVDLDRAGKDIPCNTQVYFTRDKNGDLDMTVCCRSNDMIWGAYGANAVHFSMLQEYVASSIGCLVGRYWQMSNNFHAYIDTYEPLIPLADLAPDPYRAVLQGGGAVTPCPYAEGLVAPYPMMSTPEDIWMRDLHMFLQEGMVLGIRDKFFRKVAAPIVTSWAAFKELRGEQRYAAALEIISKCHAGDWRLACVEWLDRHHGRWIKARDDGPSFE